MTCKMTLVRQMPGRIVGRTVDLDGKEGFCLTLQAREQHIRRARATSNICTNQGLMVTAATIYMSLMGAEGLSRVANNSHVNTNSLVSKLVSLGGVSERFDGVCFHEAVIDLPIKAKYFIKEMAKEGFDAGFDLGRLDKSLQNSIMVCSTGLHYDCDHDEYVAAAKKVIAKVGG